MKKPGEEVSYKPYAFSLQTLSWITILIIVIMAALYALFGVPPRWNSSTDAMMYFHSIGIGIAALAVYMVLAIYDLERHEPKLDLPISYRTFAAVLFSAAGGVFYLPGVATAFAGLGLVLMVFSFVMIGDSGSALFIELFILPRKLAGVYDSSHRDGFLAESVSYIYRIVPHTRADFSALRKMNAAYWLVLASIASAFVAGLIGFSYLWVMYFGSSFFTWYFSLVGLNAGSFLSFGPDPHTHEMALSIMAAVVGLAAAHFGVLNLHGIRQRVARAGTIVSFVGVIGIIIVYAANAFGNWSPPALFAGGPGGINGIAGDDLTMSIIAIGAMILLIPLALSPARRGKIPSWKDPIRLIFLTIWVVAVISNVVEGFYIETHESLFGAAGAITAPLAANDAVYGLIQPTFAVYALTIEALILLAADCCLSGNLSEKATSGRRIVATVSMIGTLACGGGMVLWVFTDPAFGGLPSWFFNAGTVIMALGAIAAAWTIHAQGHHDSSLLKPRPNRQISWIDDESFSEAAQRES